MCNYPNPGAFKKNHLSVNISGGTWSFRQLTEKSRQRSGSPPEIRFGITRAAEALANEAEVSLAHHQF